MTHPPLTPQGSFFLFGLTAGISLSFFAGYLLDYINTCKINKEVRKVIKSSSSSKDKTDLSSLEVNKLVELSNSEDYFAPPRRHGRNTSISAIAPITGTSFTTAGEGVLPRLERMFYVSPEMLQNLVKHLVNEMVKGLKEDGHTLKMLPSYVLNRPKGDETGHYLALDLGGSTLRVCEVNLSGSGGDLRLRQTTKSLSIEEKMLPADQLFDLLATSVAEFIGFESGSVNSVQSPISPRTPQPNINYKLGLTFSFPIQQKSLTSGVLLQWNKGFGSADVIGKDVVALLRSAFDRKGLNNIEISALLNDSVGTLISQAFKDPDTYIGVIIGTGTNAAYVEKIDCIPKWKGDSHGSNEMIINTEWGNYNEEAVLQLTPYDLAVDRASKNPKKQMFEKMFSGMYLGEIVRYILVELASSGELFNGKMSDELRTPYSFDTMFMSRIERDHSAELSDTRAVLESLLHISSTTLRDRKIVKHVCELVGIRAARLAAAGVAALVTKINKLDVCTVAVDGSVFQYYPHFANRMRDALKEILGISAENIILEQAKDGSGLGSALTAAAVSR